MRNVGRSNDTPGCLSVDTAEREIPMTGWHGSMPFVPSTHLSRRKKIGIGRPPSNPTTRNPKFFGVQCRQSWASRRTSATVHLHSPRQTFSALPTRKLILFARRQLDLDRRSSPTRSVSGFLRGVFSSDR